MKIATWNVNSLRVRLDHVLDWLRRHQPDVLGLQETKTKDDEFPVDAFAELGYRVAFSGQPGYNGVAVAARDEPRDIATGLAGLDDPERRVLAATIGDIRLYNLYVPNGRNVESDKYQYKLRWLSALEDDVAVTLQTHRHCVLIGDFNIAPEDRDVHDPELWRGKVLCSAPEREALGRLLALGFSDVFRQFRQPDRSFSWWDYRAGGFRRNHGLRIDLILASNAFATQCESSGIDTAPRGLERPSDHTPVWAEFSLG